MTIREGQQLVDFEKEIAPLKPMMEKIAKGYLDYDSSQDIVQDVMIKLWKKKDEIYSGDDLKAFVSTVIKNRCIDELRKRKDEVLDEDTEATIQQKPSLMDNYLEMLNEYDRSIIVMYYEEKLTFKEIGDVLGVDGRKIQNRHYKIINKFRGVAI